METFSEIYLIQIVVNAGQRAVKYYWDDESPLLEFNMITESQICVNDIRF